MEECRWSRAADRCPVEGRKGNLRRAGPAGGVSSHFWGRRMWWPWF